MTFTLDLVRQTFSDSSFQRGRTYQREGRVRVTRAADNGTIIEGLVQGSARQPYQVSARIVRLGSGGQVISGECSCPVEFDCKHVAALLLHVLASRQGGLTPSPLPKMPSPSLAPAIISWLAQVERDAAPASEDYPPDIRQRLFYVLELGRDWRDRPCPVLAATSVRLLTGGDYSSRTAIIEPMTVINAPAPAKYLRPSDHALMQDLARLSPTPVPGARTLAGEDGARVLRQALATGRCRWQSISGPALVLGQPRPGRLDWRLAADGRQRPDVMAAGPEIPLPMAPPWYVAPDLGLCGPLEVGLTSRQVALLLAAPPLAAAEVAEVRARLARGRATPREFLPPDPIPPRRIEAAPVNHLSLFSHPLPELARWGHRAIAAPSQALFARLSFRYDDVTVGGPAAASATTLISDGERMIEVVRDIAAERRALRQLSALGFRPASTRLSRWQLPPDCRDDLTVSQGHDDAADREAWLDVMVDALPGLTEQGWIIEIAPDFPLRLAHAEADPEAVLSEGSGIDWFDLHLGVPVDGQRVDILPALLTLLRRLPPDGMARFLDDDSDDDQTLRLALADGRILPLPVRRLRPMLKILAGLYEADWPEGALRFSTANAALLAELADASSAAGLAWRGGERLRQLGRRLRDAAGIPPVTLPDLFHGTLRPYQQTGVAWMQLLRDTGLGGVLADDMGLGKTVQALAHLAIEKASGRADRPSLIIAPTSVLPNWQAEIETFVPSLSLLVLHGVDRRDLFATMAAHDIVLTTYPLLARDGAVLTAQPWHLVLIDEAQMVKNPATTAARTLRQLEARHRLALTGTPLENHLGELWALFDFVSPGFLGDAAAFAKSWRLPIEKKGDTGRQAALARQVRPFLLRRTKAAVAADLPAKSEITEHIVLTPAQRDLYEMIRLAMHKKLRAAIKAKGLQRSRIELLDALLKLRQACCDPRLLQVGVGLPKAASAKLVRLMEMLPELIDEGRRILLFSQFTSMLSLIEAELKTAGIPYLLLTGNTTDRRTPVRAFQAGAVPLFLISLKAGGTGLNLTAADTVIHYDPWWNPAVEAQATDRAHRIGQDKPVFVHKLLAQDSIEVKMADLKARKQALADGLFGGDGGGSVTFGAEDIEFLLGD